MSYIALEDSIDTFVAITTDDIDESTKYVDAFLSRIGVALPLKKVPYEVKQLAYAVAHRARALGLAGRGSGVNESDAYMAKYKTYSAQVAAWEAVITPGLFTIPEQQSSCGFSLQRS
jgi:hypothetical protein